MSDTENEINKSDSSVRLEYSNAFRVSFSDNEFAIDYGVSTPSDETVKIVSKVIIPADRMVGLILGLFGAVQAYEKKFDKDLGFGGNKEKNLEEVSNSDLEE